MSKIWRLVSDAVCFNQYPFFNNTWTIGAGWRMMFLAIKIIYAKYIEHD